MNNNLIEYKEFLADNNFSFEEEEIDGGVVFRFEVDIGTGQHIKMSTGFDSDYSRVDIYAFNYIKIMDLSKMECVLQRINEINCKYVFSNFFVQDNFIVLKSNLIFYNNFNSRSVIKVVSTILKILTDEYNDLMKIIWS